MNLHNTKKTLLIPAFLAAAMLLGGCSDDSGIKKPSVTISGGIPFESNAQPIGSGESSSGAGPRTSPEKTDPIYDISLTLCGSPDGAGSDDYRQLTLENGALTISGSTKKTGLNGVIVSMCKVDLKKQSGSFVCTVSKAPMLKGYISVNFEDERGAYSTVRLRFVNGKFAFPDVLDIAQSNKALVSGEISKDAESVTLKNITESGSAGGAEQILGEIKRISDEICAGIDSDYEKLRAVSRWVSENIYYDHDSFSAGMPSECLTLEFMLKNKRSICGGYANMTAALAQAQGIACYSISGEAATNGVCYKEITKGEIHEWNYAVIDGRGVWVDSGWNSNNHYGNGRYSSGIYGTQYFDIGNEYFALNHKALKVSDRNFFGIL